MRRDEERKMEELRKQNAMMGNASKTFDSNHGEDKRKLCGGLNDMFNHLTRQKDVNKLPPEQRAAALETQKRMKKMREAQNSVNNTSATSSSSSSSQVNTINDITNIKLDSSKGVLLENKNDGKDENTTVRTKADKRKGTTSKKVIQSIVENSTGDSNNNASSSEFAENKDDVVNNMDAEDISIHIDGDSLTNIGNVDDINDIIHKDSASSQS
eukprot:UN27578